MGGPGDGGCDRRAVRVVCLAGDEYAGPGGGGAADRPRIHGRPDHAGGVRTTHSGASRDRRREPGGVGGRRRAAVHLRRRIARCAHTLRGRRPGRCRFRRDCRVARGGATGAGGTARAVDAGAGERVRRHPARRRRGVRLGAAAAATTGRLLHRRLRATVGGDAGGGSRTLPRGTRWRGPIRPLRRLADRSERRPTAVGRGGRRVPTPAPARRAQHRPAADEWDAHLGDSALHPTGRSAGLLHALRPLPAATGGRPARAPLGDMAEPAGPVGGEQVLVGPGERHHRIQQGVGRRVAGRRVHHRGPADGGGGRAAGGLDRRAGRQRCRRLQRRSSRQAKEPVAGGDGPVRLRQIT